MRRKTTQGRRREVARAVEAIEMTCDLCQDIAAIRIVRDGKDEHADTPLNGGLFTRLQEGHATRVRVAFVDADTKQEIDPCLSCTRRIIKNIQALLGG